MAAELDRGRRTEVRGGRGRLGAGCPPGSLLGTGERLTPGLGGVEERGAAVALHLSPGRNQATAAASPGTHAPSGACRKVPGNALPFHPLCLVLWLERGASVRLSPQPSLAELPATAQPSARLLCREDGCPALDSAASLPGYAAGKSSPGPERGGRLQAVSVAQ